MAILLVSALFRGHHKCAGGQSINSMTSCDMNPPPPTITNTHEMAQVASAFLVLSLGATAIIIFFGFDNNSSQKEAFISIGEVITFALGWTSSASARLFLFFTILPVGSTAHTAGHSFDCVAFHCAASVVVQYLFDGAA